MTDTHRKPAVWPNRAPASDRAAARRGARLLAAAGLALTATAFPGAAQEAFPSRSLTVVVPFGPGGGSDQDARALAEAMEETDDFSFQIDNKPGAAGVVGSLDALGRPADGYTLLQGTDGLVSSIATGQIDQRLGEHVVPVCLTQSTYSQIYVRADDERLTSIEDVIKAGRAARLTVANTSRAGSYEDTLMRSLAGSLGLDVEQINFDNPSERYAALLGGQVDLLLEQPGDVRAYLEAEEFKPVLTLLPERPEAFADTPAVGDVAGAEVPELERVRGLFIRADVPADRQAILADACARAYRTETYQEISAKQFVDPERSFRGRDEALRVLQAMEEAYRGAAAKGKS